MPGSDYPLMDVYKDILARYGLDAALTSKDAPALWAAALLRHWGDPLDARLCVPGLRFGVGLPGVGASIRVTDVWRFEREGAGLCSARVEAHEEPSYPLLLLTIERPSAGRGEALVDAGRVAGPLAGSGAATLWRLGEGGLGGWRSDADPVSWWIS